MSETPWGDASDLRTRMLRPGPRVLSKVAADGEIDVQLIR
jgi:hypothetical protein